MEQLTLQLRFQTEGHNISADTLVKVMKDYVALIKESNKELEGLPIDIIVNAFSEGSFVVNFGIKLKKYFSDRNVAYLANIASILSLAFAVYSLNDTKTIDNSVTINNNIYKIDNKHIEQIIENQNVNRYVTNIYKTIIADKQVKGIDILIDNNEVNAISKDMMIYTLPRTKQKVENAFNTEMIKHNIPEVFHNLPKKTEVINEISFEIIDYPENLLGVWTFLYNGIIINAVVDKSTIDRNIYKFNIEKGKAVNVDLEVTKEWNTKYNTYVNKEYKIYKFN